MRNVPEWIGKTDDSRIPPRVRLRVFEAYGGKCAECSVKLGPQMPHDIDHTHALANGGENRESNLRPLCKPCHKPKTAADVAMKKKDRRVRQKHLGITPQKAIIPGSKDSKLKRKINGSTVLRSEDT